LKTPNHTWTEIILSLAPRTQWPIRRTELQPVLLSTSKSRHYTLVVSTEEHEHTARAGRRGNTTEEPTQHFAQDNLTSIPGGPLKRGIAFAPFPFDATLGWHPAYSIHGGPSVSLEECVLLELSGVTTTPTSTRLSNGNNPDSHAKRGSVCPIGRECRMTRAGPHPDKI
jgi:hypothetical protein